MAAPLALRPALLAAGTVLAAWAWGAAPPEACGSAEGGCQAADDPSLLQTAHRASALATEGALGAGGEGLPPLRVPPAPPVPPVKDAYGPVRIAPEMDVTVADFIKQNVEGVADVIQLNPTDPGYDFAFKPTIDDAEGNVQNFYVPHLYPTLFGDNGSTVQPGYGGIMKFNVVNITPSAEGVPLYRVGGVETSPSHNCNIWWGFEYSYTTSVVGAATNVQICSKPGAMSRCTLTETFTAVVGQGWPIGMADAKYPRKCLTDEGKVASEGDFVTEYFLNKKFENPPLPTVLQVVLPACQLVDRMSSELAQCWSRNLPKCEKKLEGVKNLVAWFEPVNETNGIKIAKRPPTAPTFGAPPPPPRFDVDLAHR